MAGDLTFFLKNSVHYYGVFCTQYDTVNPYTDMLTAVRKKYYESGLKTQKLKTNKRLNDVIYRYNYNLNEDTVLKWRVYNETHIVERGVSRNNQNYRVEIRDRSGTVLRKCIYFGTYHNWVKTKYYDDTSDQPVMELAYFNKNGVTVMLRYTPDCSPDKPEILYPCTPVNDDEIRKKLTDKLGTPDVFVLCTNGFVYFADHEFSKKWNDLYNEMSKNPDPPMPDRTDTQTIVMEPVKENVSMSREENERIDLTQTREVIIPNVVREDSVIIKGNMATESSQSLPSRNFEMSSNDAETKENIPEPVLPLKNKVHSDSLLSLTEEDTSESNEEKYDTSDFDVEIVDNNSDLSDLTLDDEDIKENSEEPMQQRSYEYRRVRPIRNIDPFENLPERIGSRSDFSKGNSPAGNTLDDVKRAYENVKAANSAANVQTNPPVRSSEEIQRKSIQSDMPFNLSPSKTIRVNEDEIYYYYGQTDEDGRRNGYGRTAMKNGHTAYDGTYTGDLRNGFGVYYYRNGKVCYVGDWKNNHKHGVGISFNHKDRTMYVGGWENDNPIGMGAKFDNNGELSFAGRWANGRREGVGMLYNPKDGGVFVSRWENDVLSERGTVFDSMGNLVYNGSWKKGTRNGVGTQYDKQGLVVYSGEWKNGKYDGEGMLNLQNGYKIVGEFVNGRVQGYAVVTTRKGKVLYEGQWLNNRYNGEGKLYNLKNGSWCQGTFSNGDPVGILLGYNKDGELIYQGEWNKGRFNGNGIGYENGEKVYDGEWVNGIRKGNGTEYKNGRCIFTGEFSDNMRCGFGKSYDENEELIYCGMWKDNLYEGEGVLYELGEPRYVGSFKQGVLNGRVNEVLDGIIVGECLYTNGQCKYKREYSHDGMTLKYEGHIKNGKHEGMGCQFTEYGEKRFEGIFKNNEPFKNMKVRLMELEPLTASENMKGTPYNLYIDGNSYVVEKEYNGGAYSGMMINGKPEGKGTILYFDHGYTGVFSDGTACGLGVIYEWDGSEVTGTFAKYSDGNTTDIVFANDIVYHIIKK